jgi:hypothetical protein
MVYFIMSVFQRVYVNTCKVYNSDSLFSKMQAEQMAMNSWPGQCEYFTCQFVILLGAVEH